MNWLSVLLSLVLAGLLAALAVALPFAILRNLANGHERRRLLATGVSELRLGRMLDGLGRDRSEYLHSERVLDIELHMQRCGDCQATDPCDNLLDSGQPVKADEADFCPNMDELRKAHTSH